MVIEDELLSVIGNSDFHSDKQRQDYFLDKLFESARQLNPSIIEPYIDEADVFEDGTKYRFLNKIKITYDLNGKRSEMEIVCEGDFACLGEGICKFGDGTSTEGMKIRGFRYFGGLHKAESDVEPQRKLLNSFGFVLRYDREGYLMDVMLCGVIVEL